MEALLPFTEWIAMRFRNPWSILWPLLIWLLWLRQAWPVPSLFHGVPAGEDTWEAVALLLWYTRTLQEGHGSPFFYPLAFAPQGLHTISLAYTPLLIGLMLPWSLIGGPAFAYNLFGWIVLTLSFLGAFRLAYLFTRSSLAATAVGIAYSLLGPVYFGMRAFGDHMNLAWGLGWLIWMLYALERARRTGWSSGFLRFAGIGWGLAFSGSFYALPLAAPVLLTYVWMALRDGALRRVLVWTIGSAMLLAGPWAGAFLYAKYGNQLEGRPVTWLSWTSTDWKGTIRWNPYHPWLNSVSDRSAEASSPSLGLGIVVTSLVGMATARLRRQRLASWPLLGTAGIAAFLATGAFLKWGGPIPIDGPIWWNDLLRLLWAIGYRLKPAFFESPAVPADWEHHLVSPAFVFWVFIPFWEMMIFPYRYLALVGLGLYVVGAESWVRSGRPSVRAVVFTLWLLETIMGPGQWIPWPPAVHPAFRWLRARPPDGLIVDLAATSQVRIWSSGSILLAPLFHTWPTLSGFEAVDPRWAKWLTTRYGPEVLAHPERLSAIGVRYALLHMLNSSWEESVWPGDRLERVTCFDPPAQPSPWNHRICIYRVPSYGLDRITNVLLVRGWSGTEPWGIWAEGLTAEALWIVSSPHAARLDLQAFPICSAEASQRIEIWINETRLAAHSFPSCDEANLRWQIPVSLIRRGTNVIRFQFAYAASPAVLTRGRNPDPRPLAVGVRKLWFSVDSN